MELLSLSLLCYNYTLKLTEARAHMSYVHVSYTCSMHSTSTHVDTCCTDTYSHVRTHTHAHTQTHKHTHKHTTLAHTQRTTRARKKKQCLKNKITNIMHTVTFPNSKNPAAWNELSGVSQKNRNKLSIYLINWFMWSWISVESEPNLCHTVPWHMNGIQIL